MRSIAYSPALDGLRAVAVVSVMLFHLDAFALGWAGVPLFFVLSGYLITSILLTHREQSLGSYLGDFYWRRTMRIFPLYYAYLAVNAVACLAKALPLVGYGWFLTYLANYLIGVDYGRPGDGWVDHLWSLAVEEQFYLIWPAVVFFLAGSLRGITIVLILAAPVVRALTLKLTGNPYLTIVTLPGCMDMLFAGALVAVARNNRRLLWLMAAAGTAVIVYCLAVVPYADFASTPLWVPRGQMIFTGFALLFGPLMLACEHLGPITRVLETRPLLSREDQLRDIPVAPAGVRRGTPTRPARRHHGRPDDGAVHRTGVCRCHLVMVWFRAVFLALEGCGEGVARAGARRSRGGTWLAVSDGAPAGRTGQDRGRTIGRGGSAP